MVAGLAPQWAEGRVGPGTALRLRPTIVKRVQPEKAVAPLAPDNLVNIAQIGPTLARSTKGIILEFM